MNGFLTKIERLSRFFNIISGTSLVFLMCLTIADIILRSFKRPILGTYELVFLSGAIVIAFSIPFTSWGRGHVYADFLILRLSQKIRNVFNIVTRCLVIFLFIMMGWNLIKYGIDLSKSGEVSSTLQMPFYPVACAIGICCFIQCLVSFCDIAKILKGKYDE